MNLILDGHAQEMDTSECANLAELVAVAEKACADAEPAVVVAVEVNGEALSPEELSILEKRSLQGIGSVSIQRRPARSVVRSVLEQGADYTVRIVVAIDQTVEHFRGGRSDKGNVLLADVTDSLTVLTGITSSTSALMESVSEPLVEVQNELFPWLEELIEAQGEEDPLRIADVFEYEIRSLIVRWGEVMRTAAEESSGNGMSTLSN
jgi:hypothetical protein